MRTDTGPRRVGGAVAAVAAVALVGAACGRAGPAEPDRGAAPPVAADAPSGVPPADALASRAQTSAGADTCTPRAVGVRLVGFDAALGHRFTSLRVRNTSDRACELAGAPGLGVRGDEGTVFALQVDPVRPVSAPREPVVLAPGQEAAAVLEWTGELAGAGAERASALVVQLARGQDPVTLAARIEGDPADAEPLDIGDATTLRVGTFVPAGRAMSGR